MTKCDYCRDDVLQTLTINADIGKTHPLICLSCIYKMGKRMYDDKHLEQHSTEEVIPELD